MSDTSEQVKGALLDAVIELTERRGRGADHVVDDAIIRHYFERVAPQDLTDKSPIDLYASTVRHFQLAERLQHDNVALRVYNPNSDEDGWASSHTVIDLVTEDMPFIVDSVLAFLETRGLQVHAVFHPMFAIERSPQNEIQSVSAVGDKSQTDTVESFLHLETDRLADGSELAELSAGIHSVLNDVRTAVADWHPMREQALALAAELDGWAAEAEAGKPRFISSAGTDAAEVAELLRWMEEGYFTFIGYREYDFHDDPNNPTIVSRPETGLGTLRQTEPTTRDLGLSPPETAALARKATILNFTKANALSTVHRPVPLDYVGIKEIDADGIVTGERRLIGLFTSTVYAGRVGEIPVVREKVKEVVRRSGFQTSSHDHSRLLNALQLHPRDELFEADIDELSEMIGTILDLRDRRQVSFLMRRDSFGRFLSCLVYVPRDRHNTELRLKIQATLMEAYKGKSCRFSTEISNAPLARLHMVIYTDPMPSSELPDPAAIEARLTQITRTWDDFLRSTLVEVYGEDRGLNLLRNYADSFEASYRANVLAESAVTDIDRLESLGDDSLDVALHRPLEAKRNELRCKLYRSGLPITLSQFIPVLHDLGAIVVDERPYQVRLADGTKRFIYDIGLRMEDELTQEDRQRFGDAVLAVWQGNSETDGLARLVVTAGITWRDVSVLRAYVRYLLQIGSPFSTLYVIETLNQNPDIAGLLIKFFDDRLKPRSDLATQGGIYDGTETHKSLLHAIDAVVSLDADRILRSLVEVIKATVRTNHWQLDDDGSTQPALAFKFDPTQILDLPKPVPAAEIFVYSPRTEGVHLRSGRVARGGLRWSDRMEDFRTEVLGLMKAQTVKNSVIVPVGAKGGFVARQLPSDGTRDEVMAEVIACYKIFIGALLDVTDNVIDGQVVPPHNVVRHDGDDTYLVVAADKGTATFSDTANEIAESRDFWLGDAFASGGSAGYDHKVLAITARGAWISAERHFRELGIGIAGNNFTVVGIGDMSGDVFGNGLLRSNKAKLLAAFDHRDIFIDPTPDAAASFTERQRLYDMPRSTWADYDASLISVGGGVFSRTAKSIDLTPQMRDALGIDDSVTVLTPNELIKAVLKAPVDLLWNGGIGTYVKATFETDAEVGDRANDHVRIDATDLRCKILAEGGNLGVSQAGRIEFARLGGRINTDAIDNSAGVDCSDHEVNIKILLSLAVRNGDLTRKHRDELLESMGTEVCDQVLENNYAQNETLATERVHAAGMVRVHERLMLWLERDAGLNREVEELPSTAELEARRASGEGLTLPELAVLLAYTKNLVMSELEETPLAADPMFDDLVLDYFPSALRETYAELILQHPLRAELVAMTVSNDMVNRGGISMVHRLMEETSATVEDIARAHLTSWDLYDLDPLWASVRGLGEGVPASTRTLLDLEIERLGERSSRWLLSNEAQPIDRNKVLKRYADAVRTLHAEAADGDLPDDVEADVAKYVKDKVPRDLAEKIAALGPAFGFLDLTKVAVKTGSELAHVAALHGAVDERLNLSWLRELITELPRDNHWETMARSVLRDDYFREHAELTAVVLASASNETSSLEDVKATTDIWLGKHTLAVERCLRTFSDLESLERRDLSHASVAVRALSQLTRTT